MLLREDNADLRLTPIAYQLGLINESRWTKFVGKRDAIEREQNRLQGVWIQPDSVSPALAEQVLGAPLRREANLHELLRRPEVAYEDLIKLGSLPPVPLSREVTDQIEIQAKYHGYIERQQAEIKQRRRQGKTKLPIKLNYGLIRGLSTEVAEKLNAHKPTTVSQASRISGITPAAISLILIYLKKAGIAA